MKLTWWPALGALCAIVLTTVVLLVVTAFLPDEKVPRLIVLEDGTRTYVYQSVQEAVSYPLGFGVCAFVITCIAVAVSRARPTDQASSARYRTLGCALAAVFLIPFAFVLVAAIVVAPFRFFRVVSVGPHEVTFGSLYHSWTVQRSDVQDAEVDTRCCVRRGGEEPAVDLKLRVTMKDKRVFQSITIHGLVIGSAEMRHYESLLKSLVNEFRRI